ncbi:MAG: hypothetical protein CMJ50_03540 [Planctomycetaceae bacterium]|nr:hypothetical protein [Planctomycetaceae bacterium]
MRAREMGYFNNPAKFQHLRNDSDLELIRSQPDFENLARELEQEMRIEREAEDQGGLLDVIRPNCGRVPMLAPDSELMSLPLFGGGAS